jgi:putative salt-induced outer membrane protein YdiY
MTLIRALCLCVLLTPLVRADQITLKNGDRLTGAIVKNDGKVLTMKSELAGVVTVPWEAVAGITAPGPLYVGLKDSQTVVGSVSMPAGDEQIVIVTRETGQVRTGRDAVESIRSQEEQTAYTQEIDRYRNPRLVDLWSGFLDTGFAMTAGNARTATFTLGGTANRVTSRDKIGVTYTSLFASSNASGKNITTANAKRGGLSYDLNLDRKWFAFGSVELESDQFQNLDLRFVPAGGLGAHLIRLENTMLDVQLGAAANREFFSTGLNRTSGELLLSQELTHKFSAASSLHEKLTVYPNVTDAGSYRINFDTSAVTVIRKWLSWQLTASNRLLSNPSPGRKRDDILFTTGLRLTFAR